MSELFIAAMLGHFVGDYLLQSRTMAIRKAEKSWVGWLWCIFHCLIYTTIVCVFLWMFDWQIMLAVFASHYPIDRWSLGSKWLKIIQGRSFISAYKEKQKNWEIDLSFSCLVYTIVDNTLHLVLLWLIIKYML